MATQGSEPITVEMRAEVIRTIAVRGERRRGCLDRLEVGWNPASDVVDGDETIEIGGDAHEKAGGLRTLQAHDIDWTVNGKLSMHLHGGTTLLGGTLMETFTGMTTLLAGMSDDLVGGGGVRATGPADIWLAGLWGMEEKIGSATGDAMCIDMGKLVIEREYGPGIHSFGTAIFSGALYQTQASGFIQLYRTWTGIRNMVPGGGGGGDGGGEGASGGAPATTPALPPLEGAMLATSTARGGAQLQDMSELEDAIKLVRVAEDGVAAGEDGAQLADDGSALARPNRMELLDEARRLSEAMESEDAEEALQRAARLASGGDEPVLPSILDEAGLLDEMGIAEDGQAFDNPNWVEVFPSLEDTRAASEATTQGEDTTATRNAFPVVAATPGPPAPASVDDIPRDEFDDVWKRLLDERGQTLDDLEHSRKPPQQTDWEVRNPGGRHQAALDHLRETQDGLRTMMAEILSPYARSVGLDPTALRALDSGDAASDTMMMRKHLILAIAKLDEAGNTEEAARLRQTLAGFDKFAERQIGEAIDHARYLSSLDGDPLSKTMNMEGLLDGLAEQSALAMMGEDITYVEGRAVGGAGLEMTEARRRLMDFYALALAKAELGYDPIGFLLEMRASHVSKGEDISGLDDALAKVLRIMEANDPTLANIGEAQDTRSLLLARRNDAIRAGDAVAAAAAQKQLDLFDADPEAWAALEDTRNAFRQAVDSTTTADRGPPSATATARDDFDEAFTALLITRHEADQDYQHVDSRGVSAFGLHQTAYEMLVDTSFRLNDMMEQMVGPYLEDLGATQEDILRLRTKPRAMGSTDQRQPMLLRQWFKYAIEQAEASGNFEKAAEMRQALADYDAVAKRMMDAATAQAQWLKDFPGFSLAPGMDSAGAVAALQEAFNQRFATIADASSPEEVTMINESSIMYQRALMAIAEGRDPMPEILEMRASLEIRYPDASALLDDVVGEIRAIMFEHDPSIAAQPQPFDLATDPASVRWLQRQLFYAGDFDGAMDLQRHLDMLEGRPVPTPLSNWDFWVPPVSVRAKPPDAPEPPRMRWVPAGGSFMDAAETGPPPPLTMADPPPPSLLDTLLPASPAAAATEGADIVHLDDLPETLESSGMLLAPPSDALGKLQPGRVEVEDVPVAATTDVPPQVALDAPVGGELDGAKTPDVPGWRAPDVDSPPATPELNDLGATWNEAADIVKPPGRRATPEELADAQWRLFAKSTETAEPHQLGNVPEHLALPADFPLEQTENALMRRMIDASPKTPDAVDMSGYFRGQIAEARSRLMSGQNPLFFMDTEIRRLELEIAFGGDADAWAAIRLEQLQEARAIVAHYVPEPADAVALDVRKLPDDFNIAGTLEEWRIEAQNRFEFADAKADLDAIPPPPVITDPADHRQAVAYAEWDEVHGVDYRAAQKKYFDEATIAANMDDITKRAQDDLAAYTNPMVRIELEKRELEAMIAIDSDPALRLRLTALERVEEEIFTTVPPLPPNAFGPESDARRYAQAFSRMDRLHPDRFIEDTRYGSIHPIDMIEADEFDDTWSALMRRYEQAGDAMAAATPMVEEGDPPPGVNAGALHGSALSQLRETRDELNRIMRTLLGNAGFSDADLKAIDKLPRRGTAPETTMELRQWYQYAITKVARSDPQRAQEMKATLANFDALAEREIAEAMAYADWCAAYPGIPLSPNIDRAAISADLVAARDAWVDVETLWMYDNARDVAESGMIFDLAQRSIMDGFDPMTRILEYQATKLKEGVDPAWLEDAVQDVVALLMKHDPALRAFPDTDDVLAHKIWQRNELLYNGDLQAALDIQRQIDALQTNAPVTPLDQVVDVDSTEVRTLLGDELAPAEEEWQPVELTVFDDDELQAILDAIPGAADNGTPTTPPSAGGEMQALQPQVAGDFDDYLGAVAGTEAGGMPANDAIAPGQRIPVAAGGNGTAAGGTPSAADPTAAQLQSAIEPMAGTAAVDVDAWPPAAADPVEVLDPGVGTAEQVTAYATVNMDELRRNYLRIETAFNRWVTDTAAAEGGYDLAGVDVAAQEMFEAWRARPGRVEIPEGTDLDAFYATFLARGLDFTGVRRPPTDFVETADPAQLNAWLALHAADAEIKQMARSFEGVLREKSPAGFNILTDLDDITLVRRALLQAAEETDDLGEAMSLRAMAASLDDYLYATATAAMNRADMLATFEPPRLPDRFYDSYAARELEALAGLSPVPLSDEAEEAYSLALRRAAAYLEAGEDPRIYLDTQVRFLEAQLADAGGNARRRRALQAQLDGYRQAQATLGEVMTKWTQPPRVGVPADFAFNQSWAWIQAEPNVRPVNVEDPTTGRFQPYVPGSLETDLSNLAGKYAARIEGDIPAEEFEALDKTDLAAVRARIEQLHREALANLDNPVGGALTADPFAANRYAAMLNEIDANAWYLLDEAGLAGNVDGAVVRSQFPALSASMDEWAAQNGAANWADTGLTEAQADAFAAWRRGQSVLDAAAEAKLQRYLRTLQHLGRRYSYTPL